MNTDPFDLVGDVLDGQFRVDAFAGAGDLSVVYKGHHLGVDAAVAIKCLNLPETLDPALAQPLVDGFKEASRVHYRLARGNLHIAQSIASGSTLVPRSGNVVPYFVREWFEGESLQSQLARRHAAGASGRPLDEALALLDTAFDGVAHAHAIGETHLSINPSNLFVVTRSGSTPSVLKVLDFGVARTMNGLATGTPTSAQPRAGLRLLFPAYAAPEQLDRAVGPLGPATDVYALALVTMELLSDRRVMDDIETGAIMARALDSLRRPTPEAHGLKLPSHVERALCRALELTPDRRQKGAAELWKDLRTSSAILRARSSGPPLAISTTPPRPHVTQPSTARGTIPPATSSLARVGSPTLVGLNPAILAAVGAIGPPDTGEAVVIAARPMAFEPKIVFATPIAPDDGLPPPPPLPASWIPAEPSSAGPPPAAPSTSGAVEGWPRLKPKASPFASTLGGRVTRALLAGAGALFWTGVVVLLAVVAAGPWHLAHRATARAAAPAGATAVPAIEAVTARAHEATLGKPPPAPEPSPAVPVASAPFRSASAIRALDAKWREVAKCRRGKAWGKASTTVTFAPDGSVAHVDVGTPFAGTPAADCIASALGDVHIQPPDKSSLLVYRVYVAPK